MKNKGEIEEQGEPTFGDNESGEDAPMPKAKAKKVNKPFADGESTPQPEIAPKAGKKGKPKMKSMDALMAYRKKKYGI